MSLVKTLWSGPNKAYVRQKKIEYIKNLGKQNPLCLTFPGASLAFEKLLVDQGVTTSQKIIGVQTPGKVGYTSGSEVLKELYTNSTTLGLNIPVFVGDFRKFPLCHKTGQYEDTGPAENSYKKWRQKRFGISLKFDALDLDMCCAFNVSTANAIEKLFEYRLLSDRGVLILNHMKGREQPKSVMEYVRKHSFSGVRSGDYFAPAKNIWRLKEIPIIYKELARKNKFYLNLDKVIEYRDKNEDSPFAVNMIQYFFRFSRCSKPSVHTNHSNNIENILKVADENLCVSKVKSNFYEKMVD